MPGRYLTLGDIARDMMSSLEKDNWVDRHKRLDDAMRLRPRLVAKILELGSPDMYLLGTATGKKPTAVIALPDKPRRPQLSLGGMSFAKRARR